jgi:hypothetical protein
MKPELQKQLDGLLSLGLTVDSKEYRQLEAALLVINDAPKSEWNDPALHEQAKEAMDAVDKPNE